MAASLLMGLWCCGNPASGHDTEYIVFDTLIRVLSSCFVRTFVNVALLLIYHSVILLLSSQPIFLTQRVCSVVVE